MEKFNYREYLQDNWLLKEAKGPATTADLKGFATKDATLSREKRAAKGNWKGSVGKYVEDHRAEIDAAAKQGHGALRAYMRSRMMPALGPEAQEYLEQLLTGYADDQRLHQALYNILLKGHGLGLHEDQSEPEGLKAEFMDCCSALPTDPDDEEGGWFEEEIAGHVVSVSNTWGAWDRPGYNTIKIDGRGLSRYSNDDPVFNELVPAMTAKYGKMNDRGEIVNARGEVIG